MTRHLLRLAAAGIAAGIAAGPGARAVESCSLDDPERDLRRFFPELTSFTTSYLTFRVQDPAAWKTLERRLGDRLDPVFESIEVPHPLYAVDAGGRRAGYVFGANQRGTYSSIQVVAVTGPDLRLRDVYLQKIRSPAYERFQSPEFRDALVAFPFDRYPELARCYVDGVCESLPIPDPTGGAEKDDFRHVLRALAKLRLTAELLFRPGDPTPPAAPLSRLEALAERIATEWTPGGTSLPYPSPRFVSAAVAALTLGPDDPVLVWIGDGGADPGRIWPLEVVHAHPVVPDRLGGRPVAVTLTAPAGGALVLQGAPLVLAGRGSGAPAASPLVTIVPHDGVLYGTRTVLDPTDGTTFSPVLGEALRGPRAGVRLARVAGAFPMTFAHARHLLPRAPVLAPPGGADDVAARPRPTAAARADLPPPARLLVVFASGDAAAPRAAIRPADLDPSGLTRVAAGPAPLVLVQAAHSETGASSLAAFHAGGHDLLPAVLEPLGGTPWLWDAATLTVYEGLTGRPLAGPGPPLRPAVLFELPEPSWRALFPAALND